MNEEVPDRETAVEIAEAFADEECVGELGDVVDVEDRDSDWIVEFRTHTLADAYSHRMKITKSVGNVIAHDRSEQSE